MNECVNLSLFYNNQINNRKYSDKLGRYYTPISIAEILCEKIGKYDNSLVLDLGCGSGNLILGSLKHWVDCHYHGYDIDIQALNQLKSLCLKNVTLYNLDIVNQCLSNNYFDITISNPPYIYLSKKKVYKYLDKNTDLENEILNLNKIPAPLIFLTKAIENTKKNGKIGIILPNGILTNQKYQSIRNILVSSYHIESIIQLEPYVFQKTETHAHILIIKNRKPEDEYKINFYFLEKNKLINHEIKSSLDISNRLDFIPLLAGQNIKKLGDFISSISRGRKSSRYIKDNPTCNIFHTTDFEKNSGAYVDNSYMISQLSNPYYAKKGDILIARVGRNFHKKVKIVRDGSVEVSDSVIVIRPIKNHTDLIYNYLTSDAGQEQLKIYSQGTGAKYITHNQIFSLPIMNNMDTNNGF